MPSLYKFICYTFCKYKGSNLYFYFEILFTNYRTHNTLNYYKPKIKIFLIWKMYD